MRESEEGEDGSNDDRSENRNLRGRITHVLNSISEGGVVITASREESGVGLILKNAPERRWKDD